MFKIIFFKKFPRKNLQKVLFKMFSSDDEVLNLNKMLKDPSHGGYNKKRKKENDDLKIQEDQEDDNTEEEKLQNKLKEQKLIKKNLKKISQSEMTRIGEDDADKYSFPSFSAANIDSILNDVFSKGSNREFYNKLDEVYNRVENEEVRMIEKFEKTNNLDSLKIDEKDFSDEEPDESEVSRRRPDAKVTNSKKKGTDDEQTFEHEIKEDEEELQQNPSGGNRAYESYIEQWFQVSTHLDKFRFYFYLVSL